MLHVDVYSKYISIFDIGMVETWWQNGYNSIRIRFYNGKEVVFTYHSDTNWRLETKDYFVNSIIKNI